MTVAIGVEPYLLQSLLELNTGLSDSANLIPEELMRIRLDLANSCTGNERTASFLALLELYEARARGSEDEAPIPPDALFEAARFLEGLPPEVPAPDVDATPPGEVAFTWQIDREHSYLATFLGDGSVAYAGLLGGKSRTRGREVFTRLIPPRILLDLRQLHSTARYA